VPALPDRRIYLAEEERNASQEFGAEERVFGILAMRPLVDELRSVGDNASPMVSDMTVDKRRK
jgi:hypothetical protein